MINKVKNLYREPFLGGQNKFIEYASVADKVDGTTWTAYDWEIDTYWQAETSLYIDGTTTLQDAIDTFKADVQYMYPEIAIE